MKRILLTLVAFSILLTGFTGGEKKTVIYIVRHAEKDISDPAQKNPGLTEIGKKRAADLATRLKNKNFDVVFSTPYVRTIQTVAAIAQRSGVSVVEYKSEKEIVNQILTDHKGEKILVAGHSNTVATLISLLGCKPPFDELKDEDYDFLFRIEIKNGECELDISHFGQPHHVSKLIK